MEHMALPNPMTSPTELPQVIGVFTVAVQPCPAANTAGLARPGRGHFYIVPFHPERVMLAENSSSRQSSSS